MTDTDVNYRKIIYDLIATKAGEDHEVITDASSLFDDLNISEIELLELWSDIEEALEIEIDEDEKDVVETVQDIIELVEEAL